MLADVAGERPRILDLGIGHGNYGRILRRAGLDAELTGVEVWPAYRNQRWQHYDSVVEADVREYAGAAATASYHLVLLIDVLEHLDQADGEKLLADMLRIGSAGVVVSTPITNYPQRAWYGNPHEVHRHFWTDGGLTAAGLHCVHSSWVPTFAFWPPLARSAIYVSD